MTRKCRNYERQSCKNKTNKQAYQLGTSCNLFMFCITKRLLHTTSTVEPLTNDHPHQRPPLSYDHISCDGQWFLFVYEFLTSDHPSYTTTPMWFWGWSYKRGSTVVTNSGTRSLLNAQIELLTQLFMWKIGMKTGDENIQSNFLKVIFVELFIQCLASKACRWNSCLFVSRWIWDVGSSGRDCEQEQSVAIVHWHGLQRLPRANDDSTQHLREPRLVGQSAKVGIGAIQVLRNTFFWKIDTTHPLVTLITLNRTPSYVFSPRKCYTLPPPPALRNTWMTPYS